MHRARNLSRIQESIEAVGAARSAVIDEENIIRAGHRMAIAARSAGLREAIIIETDGQRPVFVRRTGLSPAQKIRLAVEDNRTQETSARHRIAPREERFLPPACGELSFPSLRGLTIRTCAPS